MEKDISILRCPSWQKQFWDMGVLDVHWCSKAESPTLYLYWVGAGWK